MPLDLICTLVEEPDDEPIVIDIPDCGGDLTTSEDPFTFEGHEDFTLSPGTYTFTAAAFIRDEGTHKDPISSIYYFYN